MRAASLVFRAVLLWIAPGLCLARAVDAGSVAGRVVDRYGALGYVNVFVSEAKLGTMTSECGYFRIDGIRGDSCTLKVQAVGYRGRVLRLRVSDHPDSADIVLTALYPWLESPCDTEFNAWANQDRGDRSGAVGEAGASTPGGPAIRTGVIGALALATPDCGMRAAWKLTRPIEHLFIRDHRGSLAHAFQPATADSGSLTWDGRNPDGSALAPGRYRLIVIAGSDSLAIPFDRRVKRSCPRGRITR